VALGVDATKFNERSLVVLRFLDVVVVVIALAPALALGAPALGLAFGAGGWVLQRVIAEADRRWLGKVTKPLHQLGVNLFEGFARIWLLAGVIVVAAVVGGRRDGLTCSLVIFGAYSVALAVKLLTGPPRRRVVQ
jgi:hypothetical protein